MRLLHTSDWHLGHTLHGRSRHFEHESFLAWLLDVLRRERVDALLISGDIFDRSNPAAESSRAFFGFLAQAVQAMPGLQVILIAGNHDSAARLLAPHPILDSFRIHVVGFLRDDAGAIDLRRILVPLRDAAGKPVGVCCAIPFLRPADLPRVTDEDLTNSEIDPLIEGVREVHAEIFAAARQQLKEGQHLVAMAHAYVVGTELSELSERKVMGGNQHAIPLDVFPKDLSYGALGHLHKPQTVGGRKGLRYAGSPVSLAMPEAVYPHQVLIVDLLAPGDCAVRPIRVPRQVDLLRLPRHGALPLSAVLARIAELPPVSAFASERRPYLEITVELAEPVPDLRTQIESALADRGPQLVKLGVVRPGSGRSLAQQEPEEALRDLRPDQVFRRLYAQHYEGEPAPEILAAFHELVDQHAQESGQ